MREIPDEALELIAGGYADMPVVEIIGPRLPFGGTGYGGAIWNGGIGFGTASGEATIPPEDPNAHIDQPAADPVHTSPPPPNVPAGVDINHLRNIALWTAGFIKGMQDQTVEYGALIIKYPDGSLGSLALKKGSEIGVDMSVNLPIPGTIVAYIHSHPDTVIDQKLGSEHDYEQARNLRKSIHADSNLLMYILDVESGDTFEYHSGHDKHTTEVGRNISKDIQ